jgi:hypothetical protein
MEERGMLVVVEEGLINLYPLGYATALFHV